MDSIVPFPVVVIGSDTAFGSFSIAAGVPLVWILDPHDRTVTAYPPGEDPVLFGSRRELTAGDTLAGFRVPVASLFV